MCSSNFWQRGALAVFTAALLSACGGGGGSTPAPTPTPVPVLPNVLAVTVDAGPTGNEVNRLYTSVTLCIPGSTQCQTIDHVLVDTGSTGLRLLASVLSSNMSLTGVTASNGRPLLNCVQFVDNTSAWGPVNYADVVLGGKTAANVPIQVIADDATNLALAAATCAGTPMNSVSSLGAKGILGLGMFKQDCGSTCASFSGNGFYFTCGSASCTGTRASLELQLQNPVPMFATDNNGLVVDLPAVAAGGAVSVNGSIIFGIGTQTNNQPGTSQALSTDSSGYITTLYSGLLLGTSFIDTGSNGNYFDSTINPCKDSKGVATGFYCPSGRTDLSATLMGLNNVSATVNFSIDNATALFANGRNAVLPGLSGPSGDATTFDWGLPFFYGRKLFSGIDSQPSSLGVGPYYAF